MKWKSGRRSHIPSWSSSKKVSKHKISSAWSSNVILTLKQIALGENYSTFSRRSRWCLKTKPVFILFRSFWGFSIFTPEWSFTGISSLRISWSIVREIPKLSISACPKSWARREIRHFHTVDQLNIWHRRWLWESAMGFPLITIPWVLCCMSL